MATGPPIGDHRPMTTNHQIDSIVSRHHAEESEADRVCRACGRPWPCDVAQIASAFEAQRSVAVASASRRATRRAAPSRIALPA